MRLTKPIFVVLDIIDTESFHHYIAGLPNDSLDHCKYSLLWKYYKDISVNQNIFK